MVVNLCYVMWESCIIPFFKSTGIQIHLLGREKSAHDVRNFLLSRIIEAFRTRQYGGVEIMQLLLMNRNLPFSQSRSGAAHSMHMYDAERFRERRRRVAY